VRRQLTPSRLCFRLVSGESFCYLGADVMLVVSPVVVGRSPIDVLGGGWTLPHDLVLLEAVLRRYS